MARNFLTTPIVNTRSFFPSLPFLFTVSNTLHDDSGYVNDQQRKEKDAATIFVAKFFDSFRLRRFHDTTFFISDRILHQGRGAPAANAPPFYPLAIPCPSKENKGLLYQRSETGAGLQKGGRAMASCPSTARFREKTGAKGRRLGEASAPRTSSKPRRVGGQAPGAAWHLSGSI
jgi:hypothetical protein